MKTIFTTLALSSILFASCGTLSTLPGSRGVSETEAAEGIRQALQQGTGKGIAVLNHPDGFFGNNAYKLFLPDDAIRMEKTLRTIGLGSQVDRAILQINRAAEDAVGYATPIFVEAIKEMTIADAINIVGGESDAATNYFRQKTRDKLISAFSPVIERSLVKLEATRYYSEIVTLYKNSPTTIKKLNPDLTSYVVDKATMALFDQIEKEEANIRANPRREEIQHVRRQFHSHRLALFPQNCQPRLDIRRLQVCHQAPLESRDKAMFQVLDFGGRPVARHHDLLVVFVQGVERVEKFLLDTLFP